MRLEVLTSNRIIESMGSLRTFLSQYITEISIQVSEYLVLVRVGLDMSEGKKYNYGWSITSHNHFAMFLFHEGKSRLAMEKEVISYERNNAELFIRNQATAGSGGERGAHIAHSL